MHISLRRRENPDVKVTRVSVTGVAVTGPRAIGPSAMAPIAIAASAIGAIAIGRLAIADAVIRRLRAEHVEIGSLRVRELEVAGQRWPAAAPTADYRQRPA
jgi:hypothetical protein